MKVSPTREALRIYDGEAWSNIPECNESFDTRSLKSQTVSIRMDSASPNLLQACEVSPKSKRSVASSHLSPRRSHGVLIEAGAFMVRCGACRHENCYYRSGLFLSRKLNQSFRVASTDPQDFGFSHSLRNGRTGAQFREVWSPFIRALPLRVDTRSSSYSSMNPHGSAPNHR